MSIISDAGPDEGSPTASDDMADDMANAAVRDMATADLAPVPDMVLTCPGLGTSCHVGQGACYRTGKTICTAQGVAGCSVQPGQPDLSGTWHMSAAPNGSWDWDCSGAVDYQYPLGTTEAPAAINPVCESLDQFMCLMNQIYYPSQSTPCGNMLLEWVCTPGGPPPQPACSGGIPAPYEQEGCH
jgi:hypothetical protein